MATAIWAFACPALEEGLVSTLQHALDLLKRFSAPATPARRGMATDQERRLGQDGPAESGSMNFGRHTTSARAPVYRFRVEDLRRIGWRLFAPAEYVNWCVHAQEFVPLPDGQGWCRLVPVLGEVA